jgi:hypothetical protein
MGELPRVKKKAALIEGMVRRKQWSMKYKNIEDTVSKLPNREKKEALEILEELVQDGWAEYHKNGECVSLRSNKRKEIREFLEEHSDMEDWMLDSLF